MRYIAAAILALAPFPALAQSDNGQAVLKAQLEAARVPIFYGDKVIPGVSASYSMRSEACDSFLDTMLPSYPIEGALQPARITNETIHWGSIVKIEQAGAYVTLLTVGLPGTRHFLYAGTPEGAQRMKVTAEQIAASCRSGPAISVVPPPSALAQTAPSQRDFGERIPAGKDPLGNPQCTFPAVPGLKLVQSSGFGSSYYLFEIKPREGGDSYTNFRFGVSQGDGTATWHNLLAIDPQFRINDERFRTIAVYSATLTLDGKPFPLQAGLGQGEGFEAPYSSLATIAPLDIPSWTQWFRVLETASTLEIRIVDEQGNSRGPWTFDLGSVRNVPAAIKAAGFTC